MNQHVTLTYEERARANAKAIRDRLYGKPKVVNIAKSTLTTPASVLKRRKRVYYAAPTRQMLRNEPRHHVDAWKAYKSALNDFNQPRRFVKMKCFEYGVTYELLCSSGRPRYLSRIREQIIQATHDAFPTLSTPILGKLINKDHTSVLKYLGRLKCKSQAAKKWREKKARAA